MGDTFSVKEVSELFGLDVRSVRNAIRDGRVKARKEGGTWLFSQAEAMRLVKNGWPTRRARISKRNKL